MVSTPDGQHPAQAQVVALVRGERRAAVDHGVVEDVHAARVDLDARWTVGPGRWWTWLLTPWCLDPPRRAADPATLEHRTMQVRRQTTGKRCVEHRGLKLPHPCWVKASPIHVDEATSSRTLDAHARTVIAARLDVASRPGPAMRRRRETTASPRRDPSRCSTSPPTPPWGTRRTPTSSRSTCRGSTTGAEVRPQRDRRQHGRGRRPGRARRRRALHGRARGDGALPLPDVPADRHAQGPRPAVAAGVPTAGRPRAARRRTTRTT